MSLIFCVGMLHETLNSIFIYKNNGKGKGHLLTCLCRHRVVAEV